MHRENVRPQRRFLARHGVKLLCTGVVKPPHLALRCLEGAKKCTSAEDHGVHASRNGNARVVRDAAEIKEARVRRLGCVW
jgi:hypothetical protein